MDNITQVLSINRSIIDNSDNDLIDNILPKTSLQSSRHDSNETGGHAHAGADAPGIAGGEVGGTTDTRRGTTMSSGPSD